MFEKNEEKESGLLTNSPWYIRALFKVSHLIKEQDPLKLSLWAIGIAWIVMITILILLPFFPGIEENVNRLPLAFGSTAVVLTYWLVSIFYKHVTNRVCVLALNGQIVYVRNDKVISQPKSELLFVCDKHGNTIYCEDETKPIRYMKPKTICVPRDVVEMFKSVKKVKAISYSNCKLTENNMDDTIDYTIFYTPLRLDEERLLRDNRRLELSVSLGDERILSLTKQLEATVRDLPAVEKARLEALIQQMQSLRSAMFGTPEDIRNMLHADYQGRPWNRYGYSSYDDYGSSYRSPNWNRFQQPSESEEE